MNREYLQLAHTFNPEKHCIAGWHLSEKLDGMRAYWDGGISRGKLCSEVPWANTAKDYRRVTPPFATGLWSRYGKPIAAPDYWLDELPENIPLDGELYMGRGQFQSLISCVKRLDAGPEWDDVQYKVFDIPSDYYMFSSGKINNPNCKLEFEDIFIERPVVNPFKFHQLRDALANRRVEFGDHWSLLEHVKLSFSTEDALEQMYHHLNCITNNGGEGVVLRNPNSVWVPKRTHDLLKVKKLHDAEGLVTGYTWGKGKLEGLMGSMTISWGDKSFELSGFTDAERLLTDNYGEPGSLVAGDVSNNMFPRGSIVTFKYRELTRDGIPKEARYFRY